MSTMREIKEAQSKMPLRHTKLTLDCFAEDWREKPIGGELVLGLRKYSEGDGQTARAEAAVFAHKMHDDYEGRVEAFNDALMRWLVVRGTCDANDVTQNAPIFDGSEENVRNALTSNAIRFLFDEIERFHIETSPLVVQILPEEILELIEILKMKDIDSNFTSGQRVRFRKLLKFCLSELQSIAPGVSEDDLD